MSDPGDHRPGGSVSRAPLLAIALAACTPALQSLTGEPVDWVEVEVEVEELADVTLASEPMTAPPEYAGWWMDLHRMLDLPPGDLSGIRWRVAATGLCLRGDGTPETPCTRGLTLPGRIVVLTGDAVSDRVTVMHEMAHVALGLSVGHDHPVFAALREGRCAP